MKRTITWLATACVLVAILAAVVYLVPAHPLSAGSAPATPAASPSASALDLPALSEAPVPPPSIGLPSGVATAIPSGLATLTGKTPPKVTPAPSSVGRIRPPVVVAKGWATYQPGSGWWGSPSARIRSWGVDVVRVCGPLACHLVELRNGCACGDRHGLPTLVDLAEPAWIALCGSSSAGICRVTVSR